MFIVLLKALDPNLGAWKGWLSVVRSLRGDLYFSALGEELRRYGLFFETYLYFRKDGTVWSFVTSSTRIFFDLFFSSLSIFSPGWFCTFSTIFYISFIAYVASILLTLNLSWWFYSFNYFNSPWHCIYLCSFYSNKSLHFAATASR